MRAQIYETDVLIIGGGLAATRAAIAAAELGVDVVVATKAPIGKSGASAMAGGAIVAALEAPDSPEIHYQDMLAMGRGLTDKELARINAEEAPARVRDLVGYCVDFPAADGRLKQTGGPGHTYPRILHAKGGGGAYLNPLRRKMASFPNIRICEDVMATRLLIDRGKANGAVCLDIRSGELAVFAAGATIMATGGYQDLYPASSASSDVTGDGYVMAFEAGAELVDLEILLYYPTALLTPASIKGTLIMYEYLLRQEDGPGARLVNVDGEDLLEQYDSLPARDVLARRIFNEVTRGKATERGGVFMDLTRSPKPVPERIEALKHIGPTYGYLSSVGVNWAESRFEVGPAAHTVMGGIGINARCETNVGGLYAAGEAAGNVHGANRLGGNAVTDTQVFGCRAGQFAAHFARDAGRPRIADEEVVQSAWLVRQMIEPKADPVDALAIKNAIRRTMFEYAGPAKNEEGLTKAIKIVEAILHDDVPRIQARSGSVVYNYSLVEALEATAMARAAILICHAALLRRESRGHHYRMDFPLIDQSTTLQHTRLCLCDGELVAELYPVE